MKKNNEPWRSAWVAVRQYVPKTLKDVLTRPRDPSPDALRVATDLAVGLTSLHQHGIIHGDLRPSNVFFGSEGTSQLLDYGLGFGREIRSRETRYMAPEYLIRKNELRAPADVYSFGKLVRELAFGRHSRTSAETALLSEVIDRCLDIDPQSRPTANQILSMLRTTESVDFSSQRFRGFRFAVVADLDARLPSGLGHEHDWAVNRLVTASCDRLAIDLRTRPSDRATRLNDLELVHLLSTAVLLNRGSQALTRAQDFTRGTLRPVEFSLEPPKPPDREATGAKPLAVFIDPQWHAEIVNDTTEDLQGLNLTNDEIARRVEDQVAGAEELTRSIVQSDAFIGSDEVASIMSRQCPGITADEVRILGDLGHLLAIPVDGRNLYPFFQFDRSGLPYSAIQQVLLNRNSQKSAWGGALWWFLCHPSLRGMSPADWLRSGGEESAISGLLSRVVA